MKLIPVININNYIKSLQAYTYGDFALVRYGLSDIVIPRAILHTLTRLTASLE
jgi:hypothetical protein